MKMFLGYPPVNGANEQSKICLVSRGGNFFDPQIIIEQMIIEHNIIDVFVIKMSYYRAVLLSKASFFNQNLK